MIAVLIFIIVDLIINKPLTIKQCLLSFLGWDSVGNSNWYIFIILLMYLITFVSFYRVSSNFNKPLMSSVLLVSALCILLSYVKQEYWFNTMFCYVVGLCFSVYKERTEDFIKSHYWQLLIIAVILLFILDMIPYHVKGLVYNMFSIIFCCLVVLLTMKFKINNPILLWCGKNLFPLYIYQRIPMLVLSSINDGAFTAGYPFLFIASCMIITIIIASGYKFICVRF